MYQYKKILKILRQIYYLKYEEIKLFIKQPKKGVDNVVYVIRPFKREGLMSMVFKICRHIEYAEAMGYIPYVDLEHFDTMYRVKGENIFERFYAQKYNKAVIKRIKKKCYIISNAGRPDRSKMDKGLWDDYWINAFNNYEMKKKFIDTYLPIEPELEKQILLYSEKLNIGNCVGCLLRGTDYTSLKPKNHPVQPSIDEVIIDLREILSRQQSDIFLVTEDIQIKERMIKEFGESIIMVDEDYCVEQYSEGEMLYETLKKNQNLINNTKQYLVKIALLSKCKNLVASRTNGSLMASIMNGNIYESRKLYDKGIY